MENEIIEVKANVEDYINNLKNIDQFLMQICIEGGCGYDLKQISYKLIRGQIDLAQAIQEWKSNGHYLL